LKDEKDFQVGEQCYYSEDGCKWRCTILGIKVTPDDDDDEKLEVTLRLEEVIRPNPLVGDAKIGEEFTVEKLIKGSVGCGCVMWRISEVD
jgi:hypothetical protein